MNHLFKNSLFILFVILIPMLFGCAGQDQNAGDNTIVMLKFKAQPNKGGQAVSAMMDLLEEVKKEPHFVSIKVHVDPNDESNIFFYEEWDDPNYYNGEHMNTPHLQAFMKDSQAFLMGPPDITFWKVEKVVK